MGQPADALHSDFLTFAVDDAPLGSVQFFRAG